MKIDNFIHNRLMGGTIQLLSRALNFRSANHSVITANLANIETPGYRPKEVTFNEELKKAVADTGLRLKTTNGKHFPHSYSDLLYENKACTVETRDIPESESGQLNIDTEMAKMAQNNLLFEASVRLLSKKFESLKSAITSGRG